MAKKTDAEKAPRISNSFNADEVEILDFICKALLRGSAPTVVVRKPAFNSICRKVVGMKRRFAALGQQLPPLPDAPADPPAAEPEESADDVPAAT